MITLSPHRILTKIAHNHACLIPLIYGITCGAAYGIGNIRSGEQYAWSETTGWYNAAATNANMTIHHNGTSGYLTGFIWNENIGWISLGYPGSGPHDNSTAEDWGVNIDQNGSLTGYAWCETAGWINFNPTHSQVTIDMNNGQFNGYAWGENIGYISFRGTAQNASSYLVSTVAFSDVPVLTDSSIDGSKVQLTWSGATGTPYEIVKLSGPLLRSDDPNQRIWETIYRKDAEAPTEMSTLTLPLSAYAEYYQLCVAGAADGSKIYANIRVELRTGWCGFAPPMAMDRRMNGELGDRLASVLTPAAIESSAQAEAAIWDHSSWHVLWLKNGPVWCNAGSDTETTIEVPVGRGMFVRNRGSATNLVFFGEIPQGFSATNTLAGPGRTMVSMSLGKSVPLQEAFDELLIGQITGSAIPAEADMIFHINRNGSWNSYQYIDGTGAEQDGQWIDTGNAGSIADKVMHPGETFYYQRQGDHNLSVRF